MKSKYTVICFGLLVVFTLCVEGFAHEWMAPKEAAQLTNPLPHGESTIANGKELYQNNCAYCHGQTLQGLPADETGLSKDAPNLKASFKSHAEGDLFWKIREGRGDMPSFKEDLSDEETWTIINYIKSVSE